MLYTLVNRLLQALLIMLLMTMIVFIAIHVIGNPVDILIASDADENDRLRLMSELGLDQPLWQQYAHFLGGILDGNMGHSFVLNEPAMQVVLERLPATLELAVFALIIALVVSLPLGLYAGLKPESPLARVIMAGSILGFSLPTFWVGLMLIMLFAVTLGWLPSGGRGDTASWLGIEWAFLTLDGLRSMILPAITLALFKTSLLLRLTRAGVREVLPQDFIRYARARGLSEARIVSIHVLRNIMIPITTIAGLEFGSLIAFSVVTETIFAWPGIGKLVIDSINMLDRPVLVAYLMLIVLLFIFLNLLVDALYTLLDPRVRRERTI